MTLGSSTTFYAQSCLFRRNSEARLTFEVCLQVETIALLAKCLSQINKSSLGINSDGVVTVYLGPAFDAWNDGLLPPYLTEFFYPSYKP